MQSDTGFDPEALLNVQTDYIMPTFLPPVPEGEYSARIGDGPDDVTVESFKGKKDPTKTYYQATLQWYILDEGVKQQLGRESVRVRQRFFIDLDPATGAFLEGQDKNVALGAAREAVGLNQGAFSLAMFKGQGPALIRVTQRADEKDPKIKYAEVSRVVKL